MMLCVTMPRSRLGTVLHDRDGPRRKVTAHALAPGFGLRAGTKGEPNNQHGGLTVVLGKSTKPGESTTSRLRLNNVN
jgi:hypothetical protein